MAAVHGVSKTAFERMFMAPELVRDRLRRATRALEQSHVDYAVVGGNAVAAWVAEVDPSAVRNTADVDILLREDDFDRARAALEAAGFVYRELLGVPMFLDGPEGRPRDAVHIVMANKKVRAEYAVPAPDVAAATAKGEFCVVDLEALVTMKLTSFRRKDQVHLEDLIEVGLIDATWVARFPPPLAERLQLLLDTPGG